MKKNIVACVSSLVVAIVAWVQPAWSDSTDATCTFINADKTKIRKASGPCKFSQRRGYVTLELNDGRIINLSPANQANQYTDEKGRKVFRTATGEKHEYKWRAGREITVDFASSGSTSGNQWNKRGRDRGRSEITCESRNQQIRNCKVSNLNEQSVRLERELGGAGCINGKTWGTQRGEIWVDKGCRAVFSYRVNY